MKEIECPNCHKTFQVDDSAYESIVAQVRSKVFREDLEARLAEADKRFLAREEAVRLNAEKVFEKRLADSDRRINELLNEITRLSGIIQNNEAGKRSEIAELESRKDRELFEKINEKDKRIASLTSEISSKENEYRLQVIEARNASLAALQEKELQLSELKARLEADTQAAEIRVGQLRELHSQQLRDKQDEIDRLKDFKMRLSTKMVGESLEQHCFVEFSKVQSMGMFPHASFTKDNVAVEGTKGDFIFRDFIDGEEYVSVMFEMKNEMDTTATKHRNDDFLEKLDKDRRRKNCEYAVLVSMLEQDNELYDAGIVDKSYLFPKMLVIRPQFFMPVLRLITEASKKGHTERHALIKELETARSHNRDFTKFEERINKFRATFSSNVAQAHKKFVAATDGIDKTIDALEKQIKALRDIKANFEASEQRLLKADEYAEENLTVKKLTYGAPLVRKLIDEAEK